MSLRT